MKLQRGSASPARRTLVFELLECRHVLSAAVSALDAIAAPSVQLTAPLANATTPSGLTPAQVRKAYGFDKVFFGGVVGDGAGQTIAIVDAFSDPNVIADLKIFDAAMGLPDPPSFKIVNQSGGTKLPKA